MHRTSQILTPDEIDAWSNDTQPIPLLRFFRTFTVASLSVVFLVLYFILLL